MASSKDHPETSFGLFDDLVDPQARPSRATTPAQESPPEMATNAITLRQNKSSAPARPDGLATPGITAINKPAPSNELAFLSDSREPLTMTSLEIAELVNSRHDKVKQSIERLAERGAISLPPLGEVKIQRERRAETVQVYLVGKRDSYVIVAQLSPEFTARLVDRWQELEAAATSGRALPDFADPAAAAIAWAEQYRARQALAIEHAETAKTLAITAPKAKALDQIAAGDESLTFTQAAKILGIKRVRLIAYLHEQGWVYRQNETWLAYDKSIKAGRLEYKESTYENSRTGEKCIKPHCHVTPRGLVELAKTFSAAEVE